MIKIFERPFVSDRLVLLILCIKGVQRSGDAQ